MERKLGGSQGVRWRKIASLTLTAATAFAFTVPSGAVALAATNAGTHNATLQSVTAQAETGEVQETPATQNAISYVLNGGSWVEESYGDVEPASGPAKDDTTYTPGTEKALPTPVTSMTYPARDGYDFAGWYADEGLTNKVEAVPADASGPVTYYAKWTAKPSGHQVHFADFTGAHGSVSLSQSGSSTPLPGDNVYLVVTPDEGYELDTLTVATASGQQVTVGSLYGFSYFTMPDEDVTVSARFRAEGTAKSSAEIQVDSSWNWETTFSKRVGDGQDLHVKVDVEKASGELSEGDIVDLSIKWYDNGAEIEGSETPLEWNPFAGTAKSGYMYTYRCTETGTHQVTAKVVGTLDGDEIESAAAVFTFNVAEAAKRHAVTYVLGDGAKWTSDSSWSEGYAEHASDAELSEDYQTYAEGTGLSLPTSYSGVHPWKQYMTFGGWYDNPEFTGEAVKSISQDETADKTYYAKWVDSYRYVNLNVTPADAAVSVADYHGNELSAEASATSGYTSTFRIPVAGTTRITISKDGYVSKTISVEPGMDNYNDKAVALVEQAVGAAQEAIAAIPADPADPDSVAYSDAVNAAQEAYDALSDDQKAQITESQKLQLKLGAKTVEAARAASAVNAANSALSAARGAASNAQAELAKAQQALKGAQDAQAKAESAAKDAKSAQAKAESEVQGAKDAQARAEQEAQSARESLARAEQDAKDAQAKQADAEKAKAGYEKLLVQVSSPRKAKVGIAAGKKHAKAKLTWKAPAHVGGLTYQVSYKKKGSGSWKSKKTGETSYTVSNLKVNKSYRFRVRGVREMNGKKVYTQWTAFKGGAWVTME